jgi:glycosyltransferase involved in cell wall biosynthesis
VYYCVDDFCEWPGLDHKSITEAEKTLLQKAERVIAVSDVLQKKIAKLGRSSSLLTHGVDLAHWKRLKPPACPPELRNRERPCVLYWGTIDDRIDVAFVRRLACSVERGTVLLVGPELHSNPDLFSHPRVSRIAAVPYQRLPDFAREASVLFMPYTNCHATHAMQPLKLKEYLATGKPVVARDLPATRAWADALDLACTPHDFSAAVRRRLEGGVPDNQVLARRRLENETWDHKARQFERIAISDES